MKKLLTTLVLTAVSFAASATDYSLDSVLKRYELEKPFILAEMHSCEKVAMIAAVDISNRQAYWEINALEFSMSKDRFDHNELKECKELYNSVDWDKFAEYSEMVSATESYLRNYNVSFDTFNEDLTAILDNIRTDWDVALGEAEVAISQQSDMLGIEFPNPTDVVAMNKSWFAFTLSNLAFRGFANIKPVLMSDKVKVELMIPHLNKGHPLVVTFEFKDGKAENGAKIVGMENIQPSGWTNEQHMSNVFTIIGTYGTGPMANYFKFATCTSLSSKSSKTCPRVNYGKDTSSIATLVTFINNTQTLAKTNEMFRQDYDKAFNFITKFGGEPEMWITPPADSEVVKQVLDSISNLEFDITSETMLRKSK